MRDIINAPIESLLEDNHQEYVEQSRIGHEMKDAVLPGMKTMAEDKNHQAYRAMVQALFESGFLSPTEHCFNLDMLLEHIYGAKLHEALPAFLELFDRLEEKGYTSSDSKFNSSGDNYYFTLKFQTKPTKSEIKVNQMHKDWHGDNDFTFPTDVYRKVIIIENQSPAWAVILDHCIFTKKPTYLHLMRLKESYNDPDPLPDWIAREFQGISENASAFSDAHTINKLITTLNVRNMYCKPVFEPHRIEFVLFSLYSGQDSWSEDEMA